MPVCLFVSDRLWKIRQADHTPFVEMQIGIQGGPDGSLSELDEELGPRHAKLGMTTQQEQWSLRMMPMRNSTA